MIAWVSPLLMVRSTPRRICLGSPSGVSTLTCRSRISRVDMCVCSFLSQWSGSWVRGVDVHQDVVSLDNDWIGGIRPGGGQARSEEHTSDIQSRGHLVFGLSLVKKNTI